MNKSRTRVQVFACIDNASPWQAGRYEGNILISGPHFADFTYPVVVTTKWPSWFAVGLLIAAAGAFFVIALFTKSLVYQDVNQGHKIFGTLFSIIVALVAIAPVYWSSYVKSATWGANPDVDLLALVTAGVTAATAGLAAAHKVLGNT